MSRPDSDTNRFHPQEEKAEQKPRLVPIFDMVSEGTVGFSLVSGIADLGQRLRPESTFNQPLESLWPQRSRL